MTGYRFWLLLLSLTILATLLTAQVGRLQHRVDHLQHAPLYCHQVEGKPGDRVCVSAQ